MRLRFQSLGRDSVCSSGTVEAFAQDDAGVSIPRSGFCLFKHSRWQLNTSYSIGFNPSVGILFVQAEAQTGEQYIYDEVSIPRSGFCLFKLHPARDFLAHQIDVSIPRSGFCLFKPKSFPVGSISDVCFNPSVGILFVQAFGQRALPVVSVGVSIPRSGFCLFKPDRRDGRDPAGAGFNPSVGILFVQASIWLLLPSVFSLVSIPRSGFCLFKLEPSQSVPISYPRFNPSVGILFVQALPRWQS